MPSQSAAMAALAMAWNQVGPSGGVAGVDDDRQVALPLDIGHDRQVEGIAGRIFKCANSALAKDDLAVALGKGILGRHEQVFHGRAHAALQENRDPGAAALLEQVEVLHVAGADLEDIGISLDVRHLPRVHDLGDDRHAEAVAGSAEDLEPIAAEALEAVGAGARLERAAAQNVGTRLAHPPGDLEEQRLALDGTRPGDHRQVAAADLDSLDLKNRAVRMKLAAGELERPQDRNDLLDARNRLQRLGLKLRLVADHADDRPRQPPGSSAA